MPRGDRTGPDGLGPMTGRAAGFCAGNNVPGFTSSYGRGCFSGSGYGRGGGGLRGRGFRSFGNQPYEYGPYSMPPAEFTPEQEIEMLRREAVQAENGLKLINQRIDELSGISGKKG